MVYGLDVCVLLGWIREWKRTLHFRTAGIVRIRWPGESSNDSPSILECDAFGVGIFQRNNSSEHPGFEPFNRDRFVMLLLQFGRRNVSLILGGSRGDRMEGRKLRQSVEKHLFLPLSNAIVQVLGHGDRAHRVIDDFGCLQILLGDDDLCKVTVGPFPLVSRLVSNDNVWTLSFGESLSLGAFGEVFFPDSACSPSLEGGNLDNSGRVE